jgi:glycosyltransferase involved in cell wall biosynthesis
MNIWLFDPYHSIPSEGWRDSRFTMIGEALAEQGHQATWWTTNFSHAFKRFRSESWQDIRVSPNFCVRLVPTVGYGNNISLGRIRFEAMYAWRAYRRALETPAPDLIIGTDPSQIVGYMSVKIAKRYRVPLILDIFDQWPELFELAFPKLVRPLAPFILSPLYLLRQHNLRRADAVTSLCNTYIELAKTTAPKFRLKPSRAVTIFNGIDVTSFRSMFPKPEECSVIASQMGKSPNEVWAVYAGTLGNNYDIDALLQASLELQLRASSVKIQVAGEGPMRVKITDFIKNNQSQNLRYHGALAPKSLAKLYRICDVGLCPYALGSNVGMPDKAYDYMTVGLPIVNSLNGELAKFLQEVSAGIPYIAGDAVSLANALEFLAEDPKRRQQMAQNSYDNAIKFDQHVQYQKFPQLISDLMADRTNLKHHTLLSV